MRLRISLGQAKPLASKASKPASNEPTESASPEFIKILNGFAEKEFSVKKTLEQIKASGGEALSKWGVKSFHTLSSYSESENKALVFETNGSLHKGWVVVTVANNDLYSVRLLNNESGDVKSLDKGIYFSSLFEAIDRRVAEQPVAEQPVAEPLDALQDLMARDKMAGLGYALHRRFILQAKPQAKPRAIQRTARFSPGTITFQKPDLENLKTLLEYVIESQREFYEEMIDEEMENSKAFDDKGEYVGDSKYSIFYTALKLYKTLGGATGEAFGEATELNRFRKKDLKQILQYVLNTEENHYDESRGFDEERTPAWKYPGEAEDHVYLLAFHLNKKVM